MTDHIRLLSEEDVPGTSVRRRLVLIAGFVLGVAVIATVAVLHSPWMSVHEIEIIGADRADVAGRLAEAGIGEGAIMIWVNTAEVEAAVLADPWVRDVRAERIFPDRLVVEVVERNESAWVGGQDTWMLVAEDGTVLEVASEPGAGLLSADLRFLDLEPGDQPSDDAWHEVVAMADVLSPDVAARTRLAWRGAEVWTVVDGLDIRLGRIVDFAEKAQSLEAMLGEDLPWGTVVDLVAPSRPAVILALPSDEASAGEASEGGPEGSSWS
jgi:cell division protein FtsQ